MSSEGIAELAEIEDFKNELLSQYDGLARVSFYAIGYTIFGFVSSCLIGWSFWFHFCFWIGIVSLSLGFKSLQVTSEEMIIDSVDEKQIKADSLKIRINLGFHLLVGVVLYYLYYFVLNH